MQKKSTTEPDVVVCGRCQIVQVSREQAVVRAIVPVAAAQNSAGGSTRDGLPLIDLIHPPNCLPTSADFSEISKNATSEKKPKSLHSCV